MEHNEEPELRLLLAMSTPLMVRKGRGSQKEEMRCNTRSLILLFPNFAEQKMAWLATNIKWMKRKSKKN